MNVVKAIRDYITKMVRAAPGMKVLLMDQETTGIVSLVFSQSEVLQEEVYLFEKIDGAQRDIMAHLKAVCCLRPTDTNITALKAELRKPKYGEYYLFFTNTLSSSQLEALASADEHEVVQEVQEYYADYFSVNPDTFSLNLPSCLTTKSRDWTTKLARITDGLASVCLSLRTLPAIRFQKSSDLASQVAQSLKNRIDSQKATGLWMFGQRQNPPLLLVLDRNEDPVTPLLSAWTYQAMVHQLIGIQNNRIDMSKTPDVRDELKQIVLSHLQDPFYKQNMYKDFGDLGIAIKQLVDEFQSQSNNTKNINSIEDIKRFVEDFPEFKKMSGNVSKHVAVMGELQRQVQKRRLLVCSELEQELACHNDRSQATEKLHRLLTNTPDPANPENKPPILKEDAIRLVMLYSLRYEREAASDIDRFTSMLAKYFDATQQDLAVLRLWAGEATRTAALDLFKNKNWLNLFRGSIQRGLMGVTNIFTQHKPLLENVFQLIFEHKLPLQDFPYAGGQPKDRPTEVIVFIVGGATYEEAAHVAKLNLGNERASTYLLGGTTIHSSYSFLQDLQEFRDILSGGR